MGQKQVQGIMATPMTGFLQEGVAYLNSQKKTVDVYVVGKYWETPIKRHKVGGFVLRPK